MTQHWSIHAPNPEESHFIHHHDDGSAHDCSWIGNFVFCSDRRCRDQFCLRVPSSELPRMFTINDDQEIIEVTPQATDLAPAAA